ncbi:hypothetical protein EW146_g716 [Bondarzewia mesenterica]|uniref:SGNH hydrolase-type esterase domain-containing protein n=1 Tax=Bondarzewia mesenterica TaxID=1095465 RepID=A0A4S4M7Y2_9AGAM|nr:hypothetical protein EW146_g716 [Bondarzewia mesenterica]
MDLKSSSDLPADPAIFSSSTTLRLGPHWPGLSGLRHLIVFGDSYSAIGYGPLGPKPTPKEPLGLKFPGLTYNERDLPNWVGYIVSARSNLLVYDYAAGGQRVSGVSTQVTRQFLPLAGQKPEWAPWGASDSLFVTWVGINDCAFLSSSEPSLVKDVIEDLFSLQEKLYEAGARNFLYINVPPINRSPAVPATKSADPKHSEPYKMWNYNLMETAKEFTLSHPDITALVFSSWDTFNRVLDDPVAFGFNGDDGRKRGGGIWYDHLHPTSKMHGIIAKDVSEFLANAHPVATDEKAESSMDSMVGV